MMCSIQEKLVNSMTQEDFEPATSPEDEVCMVQMEASLASSSPFSLHFLPHLSASNFSLTV